MKVVMVLMDARSGIFQYAALLSNALSKVSKVTVIAPLEAEKDFFDDSVKLIQLPVGDTKRNFLPNTLIVTRLFRFLEVIKDECPDVIHFHNPYSSWTCLPLALLQMYRVIISLPDGRFLPGQGRLDWIVSRDLHIRFCDGIIVLSQHDKEELEKQGVKKKTYVIPHGINSLYMKYAKSNVLEENFVLFFGYVSHYKGLEYLLKAAPLISREVPDVRIIVAGRGNLSRYVHLITGIKNIEVYNEFIPPERVAELFQRAKTVVLPYIEKVPSGVTPLAYAFSKPIVATDLVVDVAKGTGLIVSPKNYRALAEATVKLLTDEELRENLKRNISLRIKELNWQKTAYKTLQVYYATLEHNLN